jgi:hypothetical protein
MAIEAGTARMDRPDVPQPQAGPQGESLADVRPGNGISIIPYVPRLGELVQVYQGPVGNEPTKIRVAVLEPPSNLVPFQRNAEDVVRSHYAKHDIKAPIPEGPIAVIDPNKQGPAEQHGVFPDPMPHEAGQPQLPAEQDPVVQAVWDKYMNGDDKNTARITLIGGLSGRAAWHLNRPLIEDMALGKIPTPDHMASVVAAYSESSKAGRDAFMDYYAGIPR